MNTYAPSLLDDNLPEMSVDHFRDTGNKSVPIYILPDARLCLVNIVLHNYIYRRWFRPYRSDIDSQRYICKFMALTGMYGCIPDSHTPAWQTMVDRIVSLNDSVCSQVDALHDTYDKRVSLARANDAGLTPRKPFFEDHQYSLLQPLFRALLVIIDSRDYDHEDSTSVGKMPVFLVRTGVEESLSAPITFDYLKDKVDVCPNVVKTTLETAIDFVIDLEARERAVFGLRPDPLAGVLDDSYAVRQWRNACGDEPRTLPDSQWVSDERAAEWG